MAHGGVVSGNAGITVATLNGFKKKKIKKLKKNKFCLFLFSI
jgi:hypothetical protein